MDSRRPGPGGEIDLGGCPVSSKMEICSLFMFLLLFEEALFENMQRAFLFKLQKANILPAKNFEIFRHLQLFHFSTTEIYFLRFFGRYLTLAKLIFLIFRNRFLSQCSSKKTEKWVKVKMMPIFVKKSN